MSGKMLRKIEYSEKHRMKLMTAALKRAFQQEVLFIEAKWKYNKIWLSNYPLFVALFLLVAVPCWLTKSPFIFLLSACWFYILIRVHHGERIRKNQKPFVKTWNYEFKSDFMNKCSILGVITAFVLLTSICVTHFLI